MRPLRPRAWYGARCRLGAAAPVVTSGMGCGLRSLWIGAGFGPPRTPPVEGKGAAVWPGRRAESRRACHPLEPQALADGQWRQFPVAECVGQRAHGAPARAVARGDHVEVEAI